MQATLIYSMIILISAFEYSGNEPASLFPFTTAAESFSIPGIYRNPLSVTGEKGYTISVCGSRPYSEEALHSYTSGIKYSGEEWGIQFLGHSFGTDFYRENRFSAAAGFSPLKILNTGFTASVYKLDIDTDEENFSHTMYDGDIGGAITPFRWITIAFIQNSISAAAAESNKYELYPERSGGILVKPCTGFSLSWNITDTAAGYINSFSAGVSPAAFFHLRGGYTPEDTRFAASLTIMLKHLNATYSLSSHPYLGYTHSFSITLSSVSELETIKYSTPSIYTTDKKININSAPPDQIKNIPGLCSRSSERIILYRSKIGPISEKGLRRIGLDNNEISSIKRNCYGLARDSRIEDKDNSTKYRKKNKIYIPPKERIRTRFRIMVKEGIPASTAIRYSELPESAHTVDIESLLAEENSLTEKQKDIIRRTCSR
ncbi:MAG TPA: helix-hairpin-helix domain-containing protein [Spirochaetota bacterium]|nr:helix-hairpin-helix domain-containing protein [Spirochaetota bacterium]HPR36262.1 helix-hairpin-helix domain-containing protein [Spirochaetota bacterium]